LKQLISTGATERQKRNSLDEIIKELPEDLRKELEDLC
jgi:hypothetical protein